ncbi:MAG: CHASE4 domain-containing protein [Steroidobacteraceae bacterium]
MSIRSKVIALIAGLFLILGLAAVLVGKLVVMPSFAALEHTDADTAMRRVSYALDMTLQRLQVSATDWGNWADTYQFVVDHNPAYIKANITPVGLRQLNVNAMLIVDADGGVVASSELDPDSDTPLGLDLVAVRALPANFPWRANLHSTRGAYGLLRTSRGTLMLAAAPVLDGTGHGPARGMVILGRLLSSAQVESLGAQAQSALVMLPPAADVAPETILESATVTRVYRTFTDVYGRPVMTLRVDIPRDITARGRTAVLYASAYLVLAAVVVLLLVMVVLNRLILKPLATVTRHAVTVGEDKDLTTRLDLPGSDEIGVLAREFDRMVQRVAESRTRLVDQSFQAGFAELAKGVLHNLGNALTPVGVRLANLGERLRQAPADDAAQALAELRQGTADAQRRADLEEFARLGCEELAHTVKAAREDVALISRQTSLIQGTLAEQMRATRNDPVVEPVRLNELVAQTLEIVPDACRRRLVISADDSLRALGAVRVARTVLRLILQNLIINAADAIRDAGKDKGTLRLGAEIVREAHGAQLHLRCDDDGVGIPADHLERLFEKGFSTKSRETNQGIGLHWCANAINALGGRIWAASDGPGRGASMHLLVPLAAPDAAPLPGPA